ncbi:GNAT family N-acetyltransferase [Parasediminibacterium paludis]|uniref:GNAT family N-acetyltransferase n=1 Tax=Parasediminibacterium paludis TaxID=908966 RepID=A0ABV8PST9_9BACT
MPTVLDFETDYLLEDDCVLLRPLQANDWQNLLYYAEQEPDIWQYSLVPVAGKANLKGYINTALAAKAAQKEYPFIVFDKRTQQYAGSTRFYDVQLANNALQLGYTWYGKSFQRTGLNRHCKYLLLQFAFETLGIERVEFRADANNARSIAAMKAIGCTVEGILRSHLPLPNGGRRDSIVLSILKEEWEKEVKAKLREMIER